MCVEESRLPVIRSTSKTLGITLPINEETPTQPRSSKDNTAVLTSSNSGTMTIKPAKLLNIGAMSFRRPSDLNLQPTVVNASSTSGVAVSVSKSKLESIRAFDTPNILYQEGVLTVGRNCPKIVLNLQTQNTSSEENATSNESIEPENSNIDTIIEQIKLRKVSTLKKSQRMVDKVKKERSLPKQPSFLRPLRKNLQKYNRTRINARVSGICEHCHREYFHLSRHENKCPSNPKRVSFTCPICQIVYTRKLTYIQHITKAHRRLKALTDAEIAGDSLSSIYVENDSTGDAEASLTLNDDKITPCELKILSQKFE